MDMIEWAWLDILYLMDVFHVAYEVIFVRTKALFINFKQLPTAIKADSHCQRHTICTKAQQDFWGMLNLTFGDQLYLWGESEPGYLSNIDVAILLSCYINIYDRRLHWESHMITNVQRSATLVSIRAWSKVVSGAQEPTLSMDIVSRQ